VQPCCRHFHWTVFNGHQHVSPAAYKNINFTKRLTCHDKSLCIKRNDLLMWAIQVNFRWCSFWSYTQDNNFGREQPLRHRFNCRENTQQRLCFSTQFNHWQLNLHREEWKANQTFLFSPWFCHFHAPATSHLFSPVYFNMSLCDQVKSEKRKVKSFSCRSAIDR